MKKNSMFIAAVVVFFTGAGICGAAEISAISSVAGAEMNIPAVRMVPVIPENDLDVSIASAVIDLKRNGATRLAGDLQRLMIRGSYAQKYEFVYAKGTYVIPKEFVATAGQEKSLAECVAKWVCKTYVHAVTFYNCYTKPGETVETCDPVVKDVVEKSCDWEC